MKRKSLYFICLVSLFSFTSHVQAKEVYYVNQNNVEFTKEEYDFISYMFWDGAQNQMSLNEFIWSNFEFLRSSSIISPSAL